MLDPIARHDFMATVLTAVADDGVSVLLSSHVLAELERVADYLILLSRGRVQVAGEVDDLLASHRVLTGPAAEADRYAERPVVHARRAGAQAHLLVRATADDPVPPGWEAHPVGLEELALAYLREPGAAALPGPARGRAHWPTVGGDEMTALTMPARPGHDARLRPVPWRRMAWVTWRQHRAALAGVAALARRARGVPVADRPSDAPRLRDRLPPGQLTRLRHKLHRQIRRDRDYRQRRSAGGAGADRGVRRGAGAGPGAGDRHLPVRLDAGLRPAGAGRSPSWCCSRWW